MMVCFTTGANAKAPGKAKAKAGKILQVGADLKGTLSHNGDCHVCFR
jgi:hypothetical protein